MRIGKDKNLLNNLKDLYYIRKSHIFFYSSYLKYNNLYADNKKIYAKTFALVKSSRILQNEGLLLDHTWN